MNSNTIDPMDVATTIDSYEETLGLEIMSIQARIGKNLPFLSIIHPQDEKRLFQITHEKQIIGRGHHVAVVLKDNRASREHCTFWLGAEGVMVEDLGSTNGTIIDNQLINKTLINQASRLLVGDHIFKLAYKDEHELEYERKLVLAATVDELTGISNRRTVMERASSLYGQCKHNDRSLAVVMLDIDHFKRVNDNWGHPAGDLVLKGIAGVLTTLCSTMDLCGRYGGEEFILLLPDRSGAEMINFCGELRNAVEALSFSWAGDKIQVTISLGASIDKGSGLPGFEESLAQADSLLYQAKEAGRNCLCYQGKQ